MLTPSLSEAFCRRFSLSDVKFATNDFSNDLIIGKGSFGNVYKATIVTGPGNTTTVAVKRRNSNSKQGSQEFSTEVILLSTLRHTHLVSLIGYSIDEDANEMILVYEYMANGTLADHIYKKTGNSSYLDWEQRLKICIGVGRGVEYLHTGTGIDQTVIHRDLKSSNILLDADWAAKLSDFGLCKTCSGDKAYSPILASVKGTLGYMDPKYRTTRELSSKTDVYAFGVVLLEVLCGRRSLDFEVADRQTRLVSWAQQCIREGVVHRIIDPGLRGEIADEGLHIFLDITLKCLEDRPNKRPTMVDVVAKLESALASQYTTYSSSSEDDEYVKVYFGQVSNLSSSAESDVDLLRHAVETGSDKSDTIKQDSGSESSITTDTKRCIKTKSCFKNNALDIPVNPQSNQVKADASVLSTTTATSETSTSLSYDSYDELLELERRMNLPIVAVENESSENATVIKVDGTNAHGVLLEVVQALTNFNLIIKKASRTSDGVWAMDVFNVIDQEGSKVTDEAKIQNIQEVLCSVSTLPIGNYLKKGAIPDDHTILELIGNDRPGLLSEISAILGNFRCNVVSAELWTHNTRTAAVMHVCDEEAKSAIIEPEKLSRIKKLLFVVLKGGNDNREPNITVSHGCVQFDRRLHELMFADRDDEKELILDDKQRPKVDVVNWNDKDYLEVSILCKNTTKVLFDAICSLTNRLYVVYHGNFDAEGPEACMEFWIRHIDGSPVVCEAERKRVIQHLQAAIGRRISEGLKIEICTKDRVGLLSDVTRIIRENSLTITRAEVRTSGDKAVFVFCLDDNLGYPVDPKIIDNVKNEIGQTILQVKGHHDDSYHVPQEPITRSTFKEFLKAYYWFYDIVRTSGISLFGVDL